MKILSSNVVLFLLSSVILITEANANQRNEKPVSAASSNLNCISGKPEGTHLIDALAEAKKSASVTMLILQTKGMHGKTESAAPCAECLNEKNKGMNKNFNADALTSLANYAGEKSNIDIKCMEAATGFAAPDTPEVICPESSGKSASTNNSCVNIEVLEYQNAVMSNMYSCFSKYSSSPINPSSLFEIHSLESSYKANFSSKKGHGLGQVTNIFVKDAQSEHRGLTMMKKIVADTTAECAAARELLTKDIKRKPILSTPKDRCRFVQIGDGLERNILYSFIGLNTLWRNDISPYFTGYSKKHGNHAQFPRLMEKLLQIGYGGGGPVAAQAIIKEGRHLSPDRFLKFLDSKISGDAGEDLNKYSRGITARQKSIHEKITDPALNAAFATEGARACLN